MKSQTIGFLTSEIRPFSKTGGLADVSAALPAWLHAQGQDVRVFTPLYSALDVDAYDIEPVEAVQNVSLELGKRTYTFSLFRAPHPGTEGRAGADGGTGLPVYLVHCPSLYDRPSLYTDEADEPVRFTLLCRAVFESCQRLRWAPKILHGNDWQTGLVPLLLRTLYGWDSLFHDTRTVLTIHNLGYQGLFPASAVDACGLGPIRAHLNRRELEQGRVGFLRTGLEHADWLTTVSPTYAEEILTEAHGAGLHEVLQARRDRLTGILNGVDVETWNPRTDPVLKFRYSTKSLWRKEKNKEYLLQELGLPYEKGVPVVGMVTRLAYQKGVDLLEEALPELLEEHDFRFVVLASGETRYERFFQELDRKYPKKVRFYRGYHGDLAHWIEAGADMFVMPSMYEPCGLNQMYSLLYGTIPVVRKTGGLADTVKLVDPEDGTGNGIVFDHYTAEGVRWAIETGLELYREQPKAWKAMMIRGMEEDFSWDVRGGEYLQLYDRVLSGSEAEV